MFCDTPERGSELLFAYMHEKRVRRRVAIPFAASVDKPLPTSLQRTCMRKHPLLCLHAGIYKRSGRFVSCRLERQGEPTGSVVEQAFLRSAVHCRFTTIRVCPAEDQLRLIRIVPSRTHSLQRELQHVCRAVRIHAPSTIACDVSRRGLLRTLMDRGRHMRRRTAAGGVEKRRALRRVRPLCVCVRVLRGFVSCGEPPCAYKRMARVVYTRS